MKKSEETTTVTPLMLIGTKSKLDRVHGPYIDRPTHHEQRVADAIRVHLRHHHRHHRHKIRKGFNVMQHHGYVASEAAYHLLGGKAAGYQPVQIMHEGGSHWYLRHRRGNDIRHIDITYDQFDTPVMHFEGRSRGFLTKAPCKRSRDLIADVEAHIGGI